MTGDDRYDCYAEIRNGLGYRFVLSESSGPEVASVGESFPFSLTLENKGFAGTMNPRDVRLILRHSDTGEEWFVTLPEDPRTWLPSLGLWTMEYVLTLPDEMPVGEYEWFLHLADPAPALRFRPLYGIQLVNEGIWEESTGYNALLRTLSVVSGSENGEEVQGLSFQSFSASYCGDGILDEGEECDLPNMDSEVCPYGETECPLVCTVLCTWRVPDVTYCGDGVVDLLHGELCDGPQGCSLCP